MNLLKKGNNIFILLVFAFIFRLLLAPYGSLPIDFNDWVGWSDRLVSLPLSQFYNAWSDYLPGYLYMLWFLGYIKTFFGAYVPLEIIYKLPGIAADLGLVFASYKISKMVSGEKIAIITAAVFAFNPAIFGNSTLWGQVDALNTFFYIASFLLLFKKRIALFSFCLTFGLLIKPQGIFMLPLTLIFAIKDKRKIIDLIKALLISTAVFIAAFIPFTADKFNVLGFIQQRFSIAFDQYQYTSVNAFNFWAIGNRWWKPDSQIWSGLALQYWGLLIFFANYLVVLWTVWRKFRRDVERKMYIAMFSLGLIFLSSFVFLTRVHERLLLTPLLLLMFAAIFKKQIWWFIGILSFTYVLNLYFSFIWITQDFRSVLGPMIIDFISVINISVFIGLLIMFLIKGYPDEEKVH